MDERAARQEPAGGVDRGDHRVVGVARLAVRAIDRAPGEQRHARQIDPVRPDRVEHRQAVRLAELPIVGAVPGAMWTRPVPWSASTKPAASSGTSKS